MGLGRNIETLMDLSLEAACGVSDLLAAGEATAAGAL